MCPLACWKWLKFAPFKYILNMTGETFVLKIFFLPLCWKNPCFIMAQTLFPNKGNARKILSLCWANSFLAQEFHQSQLKCIEHPLQNHSYLPNKGSLKMGLISNARFSTLEFIIRLQISVHVMCPFAFWKCLQFDRFHYKAPTAKSLKSP